MENADNVCILTSAFCITVMRCLVRFHMTPRRPWLLLALTLALWPAVANAQPQPPDARCEAVAQRPLMGAVITAAAIVPEGSFTPPVRHRIRPTSRA
jgi:hypothetical protein